MNKQVTNKDYKIAIKEMEKLLAIVTEKGGFKYLTAKEDKDLKHYTQIVHDWEEENVIIPMPETLQGILELKMFENKLKQKELAKLLHTTDTQLSEIIHKKRKPSLSFLKSLNQILGIDGNLLLRLA